MSASPLVSPREPATAQRQAGPAGSVAALLDLGPLMTGADLVLLSRVCGHASAAYALRAHHMEREAGGIVTAAAADLADAAIHLDHARHELARAVAEAASPEGVFIAEIRRHLAAGGTVVLCGAALPSGVVVGEPQDAAAAPVLEAALPRRTWRSLFRRAA